MIPRLGWLPLLAVLALVAVACTNPDRPRVQADEVALPTPLQSFDASMAATVAEIEQVLASGGVRIAPETRPYRPSEPGSLLQVPRAVLRADLADPDDGFVVVYQAADAAIAAQRGRELADYLGSGFGQTNYAVDTQFSVRRSGPTLIFTTWSRRRSEDPERAEAVFDAVATVGEEIEVRK